MILISDDHVLMHSRRFTFVYTYLFFDVKKLP